jgi:hypothetical protein
MSRRGFLPPVLGPLVLVHAVVPTDMMEVEESGEPSAKRKKLSALGVGDETLFHMDLQEMMRTCLTFHVSLLQLLKILTLRKHWRMS